jgi:D-galactarolactone cycloisomerase
MPPMRITDIQPFPLSIPFRRMTPPSPWADGARKQIMIKMLTDEGLVGYGEAFALGAPLAVCNIIDEVLKPLLVGENPTDIERLVEKMQRAMLIWGRRGLGMFALSGVEIALWDLAGKVRGVPVYDLLGGSYKPSIRAYASMLRYAQPQQAAEAAQQFVHQGFTAVKLHQTDVASVQVTRAAVGSGIDIMLDINCVWNPREAIERGKAFAEHGIFWFEEPVWPPEDYRGLADVAAALETPVAAGENESTLYGFREILAHRAVDIIQPSMTKVGGLLEFKKICTLAQQANVSVAPHSFYFGPGLAATLHLIAATPGCLFAEFPTGDLEASLLQAPIQAVGGFVDVPTGPGLGVELNEETLKRFPYGEAGKRLFSVS